MNKFDVIRNLAANFVKRCNKQYETNFEIESDTLRGDIGDFWLNIHINFFSLSEVNTTVVNDGKTIEMYVDGLYPDCFTIHSNGSIGLDWDYTKMLYDNEKNIIRLQGCDRNNVTFYSGSLDYNVCISLLEYMIRCHKYWFNKFGTGDEV